MYNQFFGFKERPFQLVPNPAYLFLSKCHEEALAHLIYTLSSGDGFVELTGEVGTGKTTLCRAFLKNLKEDTEVAFIFNPKLKPLELLTAINDEFGISNNANNTKDLIDALNKFLIAKKSESKNIILLIDEAQNLDMDVLEQLRLLSNLETTSSKLLQIILVGQPELSTMLDSHELRQLSQRITLSCHLVPLTFRDTMDYIRHRIRIASGREGVLFTRAAVKTVYRHSNGIPRLINTTCDRCLLTAYSLNRNKITGDIARRAVTELAGRGRQHQKQKTILWPLSLVLMMLLAIFILQSNLIKPLRWFSPKLVTKIIKPPITVEQPQTPAPQKVMPVSITGSTLDLKIFLENSTNNASRRDALTSALALWTDVAIIPPYLDEMTDTTDFFRLGALPNGLQMQLIKKADLKLLQALNLPAILKFRKPGTLSFRYLTLVQATDTQLTLQCGQERFCIEVTDKILMNRENTVHLLWKNFYGFKGSIPYNKSTDALITLKMMLRRLGFNQITLSPEYDPQTKTIIKTIQAQTGIEVDGIIGPLTWIALYNQIAEFKKPQLQKKPELM